MVESDSMKFITRKNMSIKLLTQISHFITMIFGISLGMAICMLYQYTTAIFIFDLAPFVVLMVVISVCLRVYTIHIWKKYEYDKKIFNNFKN